MKTAPPFFKFFFVMAKIDFAGARHYMALADTA